MNRREILFRGKAVIGSEWIYGGYTYDDADKDHMITQMNDDGMVSGDVVSSSYQTILATAAYDIAEAMMHERERRIEG